jgi:magnesium transporter
VKQDTFGEKESKVELGSEALIHIGEKKVEEVIIKLVAYNNGKFVEKELNSVEECLDFKDKPDTNLWINVDGLDKVDVIEKLGSYFDIHSLTLEDVLNTGQRPKMEYYESYIYAVLKVMVLNKEKEEVIKDQISIIFGYNYILSFQEKEEVIFDSLKERFRNPASHLQKYGVDYIAYSIIDLIIDNYFLILEHFEDKVEDLEDELYSHPTPETLKTIQEYKNEIMVFRKSVWPLRELISGLQEVESEIIADNTRIYLRDIYDHTNRVIDSIEDLREILVSMIDIYLSNVNNKMNDVMKVLIIITTIFITLTFIAGVYAMNFDHIPEHKSRWGYPAILLLMTSTGIIMFTYFKKRRWV